MKVTPIEARGTPGRDAQLHPSRRLSQPSGGRLKVSAHPGGAGHAPIEIEACYRSVASEEAFGTCLAVDRSLPWRGPTSARSESIAWPAPPGAVASKGSGTRKALEAGSERDATRQPCRAVPLGAALQLTRSTRLRGGFAAGGTTLTATPSFCRSAANEGELEPFRGWFCREMRMAGLEVERRCAENAPHLSVKTRSTYKNSEWPRGSPPVPGLPLRATILL